MWSTSARRCAMPRNNKEKNMATMTVQTRPAERTGERHGRIELTHYQMGLLADMVAERLHRLMKRDAEQTVGELLTREEAAAFLKVSTSYVDHNKRLLPHVKVGRSIRYTKDGLAAFAARHTD